MKHSYSYRRAADRLIEIALDEDMPAGDVTSDAVLEAGDLPASGSIVSKEELVISGLEIARRVFHTIDGDVNFEKCAEDGQRVQEGVTLAEVSGRAVSLLAGERTALNFLQRLSGIATACARVVAEVEGYPVTVLDTRKTAPGWRLLEKAAVRDGGGSNHRTNLSDGVLIKDNHIALCGGIKPAIERARNALPSATRIEVEVSDLDEVKEAAEAGADVFLLDNSDPETAARVAAFLGEDAVLEASGGITLATARKMAEAGVSHMSLGEITHSSRAVDISMKIGPGEEDAC